jgi:hypothetical protein
MSNDDHEVGTYRFCPECGTQALDKAKFCGECGQSLLKPPLVPADLEPPHLSPPVSRQDSAVEDLSHGSVTSIPVVDLRPPPPTSYSDPPPPAPHSDPLPPTAPTRGFDPWDERTPEAESIPSRPRHALTPPEEVLTSAATPGTLASAPPAGVRRSTDRVAVAKSEPTGYTSPVFVIPMVVVTAIVVLVIFLSSR